MRGQCLFLCRCPLKEEEILNDLDFNLSSATVLDFVVLYLEYRPHKANKRYAGYQSIFQN